MPHHRQVGIYGRVGDGDRRRLGAGFRRTVTASGGCWGRVAFIGSDVSLVQAAGGVDGATGNDGDDTLNVRGNETPKFSGSDGALNKSEQGNDGRYSHRYI